jgi:hypothetical protein
MDNKTHRLICLKEISQVRSNFNEYIEKGWYNMLSLKEKVTFDEYKNNYNTFIGKMAGINHKIINWNKLRQMVNDYRNGIKHFRIIIMQRLQQ